MPRKSSSRAPRKDIIPTGIDGLDRVMHGGYTRGRTTLIRGASGTGKTLFSLMFAAAAANEDAAVFASFDEPVEHLKTYLANWHGDTHVDFLDFSIDPDIMVSGDAEIDLGGILVRLEHAVNKTGAQYVVMDAFDILFSTFKNNAKIRWELNKIFHWCRQHDLTLLATAGVESSYEASTDVMDYASDCTILLAQNVHDGMMTRRLRVLKLRGRGHGTNEYPFLIDGDGISVLPVTETTMSSKVFRKRLGTGIEKLNEMLGGKGVWQGSTIMISGQSGTGKSLVSANMAAKACSEKLKVLYTSFEESPNAFIRDVNSVGIKLKQHIESGSCQLVGRRPVELGMEEQIIILLRSIADFKPDIVIIDPISSLAELGEPREVKSAILRLCHAIKQLGVTAVLTELLPDDSGNVSTMNISSIVDTWIRLSRSEDEGVMCRHIKVHKSRGAATSDRVHDFLISNKGINILTGTTKETA